MESSEQIFSDKEGNHLLVALYFCDEEYKRHTLHIPEEYAAVKIVDIDITKAHVDKPIHCGVFFRMCAWLLRQFEEQEDAVFTFICSVDELSTHHPGVLPHVYRWSLFDRLYQRHAGERGISVQDVVVGPEGYQSFGRAFYRDKHAPIVHVVASYLQEKQQLQQ